MLWKPHHCLTSHQPLPVSCRLSILTCLPSIRLTSLCSPSCPVSSVYPSSTSPLLKQLLQLHLSCPAIRLPASPPDCSPFILSRSYASTDFLAASVGRTLTSVSNVSRLPRGAAGPTLRRQTAAVPKPKRHAREHLVSLCVSDLGRRIRAVSATSKARTL